MDHVRRGSGEPLALIHFQGGHAGSWGPVADRLSSRYETWALALPGFGATPLLDERPTMRALARAVTRFMASVGHERFHVAGCSLGGAVALELGRLGVARSVCAQSPAGFAEGADFAYLHASLVSSRAVARLVAARIEQLAPRTEVRRAMGWQTMLRPEDVDPGYFAALVRSVATAPGYEPTRRHALRERFRDGHEITCPVTVAWAERDRLLLTERQSLRARRDLPRAFHVKLWACGHLPFFDDPDQVADVVSTAVSRAAAEARPRTRAGA